MIIFSYESIVFKEFFIYFNRIFIDGNKVKVRL